MRATNQIIDSQLEEPLKTIGLRLLWEFGISPIARYAYVIGELESGQGSRPHKLGFYEIDGSTIKICSYRITCRDYKAEVTLADPEFLPKLLWPFTIEGVRKSSSGSQDVELRLDILKCSLGIE